MSEPVELKPCPFCGGEAGLYPWPVRGDHGFAVYCISGECPVFDMHATGLTEEEVAGRWNTRIESLSDPIELGGGRVPSAPGSREPSREGVSAASGFDPSRVAQLRELLARASPLPWDEGWNTRYFDKEENGAVSMCGRGPDTPVLRRDHPRFNELVADQAFADAELIAAAVNALPDLLSRLEEKTKEAEDLGQCAADWQRWADEAYCRIEELERARDSEERRQAEPRHAAQGEARPNGDAKRQSPNHQQDNHP